MWNHDVKETQHGAGRSPQKLDLCPPTSGCDMTHLCQHPATPGRHSQKEAHFAQFHPAATRVTYLPILKLVVYAALNRTLSEELLRAEGFYLYQLFLSPPHGTFLVPLKSVSPGY